MKYLAFILTIYVLALSAWPCCGEEASLSSGHEDVCASASDEEHGAAPDIAHACSPFFHTSTFHAFVASPAINKAPTIDITDLNGSFPDYTAGTLILFPDDIWQPPQLG